MGTENILWKIELNQIIYPEFKVIESLKYKAIRMIGVKLFLCKIYTIILSKASHGKNTFKRYMKDTCFWTN